MAKIILEGMLFKSYIGVHDFEQAHGNRFEVTLAVELANHIDANDHLAATLDYSELYTITALVMQGRFQLIETAAEKILAEIQSRYQNIASITLRICKLDPPLNGSVNKVCIELKV